MFNYLSQKQKGVISSCFTNLGWVCQRKDLAGISGI